MHRSDSDRSSCWICGDQNPATREHQIKRSDLRQAYGTLSESNKIFLHTEEDRNIPIECLDMSILKSSTLTCARCNNQRTQTYDLAWQALSKKLFNRKYSGASAIVDLSTVWPGNTYQQAVRMHLYFVKQFGDMASEGVPLGLSDMAASLRNGEPYANLFLSFRHVNSAGWGTSGRITAELQNGICVRAYRIIAIEHLAVVMTYAAPVTRTDHVPGWHPQTGGTLLEVSAVDPDLLRIASTGTVF